MSRPVPVQLDAPGCFNPLPVNLAPFTVRFSQEFSCFHRPYFDPDIDPVHNGMTDLIPVIDNLSFGAAAFLPIRIEAAGAMVHRDNDFDTI
jgi:hypothetical protein